MVGGLSEEVKDADDTVREICEKVREEVEAKLGKKFCEFTPLKYRTQLVNGVNYFIKASFTHFFGSCMQRSQSLDQRSRYLPCL
ncbi:hypothetical protein HPB48_008218 [Haemaphysalis longicornis]|uniref:Cystatin domain-containing protein n=1 Tax=Haemaphysalis longicornis TaxID=44386 RepID=A0A9J6H2R5_HAELO|nr:hypothetical protein HPB48_008218 [Haemaphysalis longicornis]